MEEKQTEIDEQDSSDESDNECGDKENILKQDKKNLVQCIYGIECEGCENFEHCSNAKVEKFTDGETIL